MSDTEITALAREYAEESAQEAGVEFDPQDCACINCVIETKDVIKFLLRRFCLVEKSKVEQMYKEAAEGKCELEKMRPQNTYAKNSIAMRIGVNFGCVHTLKSLFPEIGKEVEE